MQTANITITRYRDSRYWAIWNGSELIAVTVYKKGAEAVRDYINTLITMSNKSKYKAFYTCRNWQFAHKISRYGKV